MIQRPSRINVDDSSGSVRIMQKFFYPDGVKQDQTELILTDDQTVWLFHQLAPIVEGIRLQRYYETFTLRTDSGGRGVLVSE